MKAEQIESEVEAFSKIERFANLIKASVHKPSGAEA